MRYKDHRDPEYYIMQIRSHEIAERVSLLEVRGVGKEVIRALYKLDITTASLFLETCTGELVSRLATFDVLSKSRETAMKQIDDWKDAIRGLIREREGKTLTPTGTWE